MQLLELLETLPRPALLPLGFVLLGAVGLLDWVTGEELAFSLFYLIPIAVMAWSRGRGAGIIFSCLAAVLWGAIDVRTASHGINWFLESWDIAVRFGFFLVTALTLAALAKTLLRERELSRTDYLTGLCNDRCFLEKLRGEIERSRRYGHPFTLVYLDLDSFKEMNDRFGHLVGDEVLRAVAGVLRGGVRGADTPCRMGGDEFALLLPETGLGPAGQVLSRLREGILRRMGDEGWPVTASAGAVTFLAPPSDAEAAVRAADELMYEVKREGKNAFRQKTSPGP